MPLDDSRPTRPTRPAPPPAAIDELPAWLPCEDDPNFLADLQRQVEDIDAGREPPGLPLEEALREMFAPPTPEELAELETYLARRASR